MCSLHTFITASNPQSASLDDCPRPPLPALTSTILVRLGKMDITVLLRFFKNYRQNEKGAQMSF